MVKAASKSTSGSTVKKTAAAKKTSSRTPKSPVKRARAKNKPPVQATSESPVQAVNEPPEQEEIVALQQRLETVEQKFSQGLSALVAEMEALRTALTAKSPKVEITQETLGSLFTELMQKNIGEQLGSVTGTLRRIEERVGFIGNRLKSSGGGQGRNRPWRRDQSSNTRPKGQQNAPRPGQGQDWTPPSAASVQGHFAPRSVGGDHLAIQEDEE